MSVPKIARDVCVCRDLRECDNCEKLLRTSTAGTNTTYEIIGEIWPESQAGSRS